MTKDYTQSRGTRRPKRQNKPHCPLFFTGVTTPFQVQSTASTKRFADNFMSFQVLQATPQVVGLIPRIPRHNYTGCQVDKLVDLQLVRGILCNCGVDKSTWPWRFGNEEKAIWVFWHQSTGKQTLTSQLSKRKQQGTPGLHLQKKFVQRRLRHFS